MANAQIDLAGGSDSGGPVVGNGVGGESRLRPDLLPGHGVVLLSELLPEVSSGVRG